MLFAGRPELVLPPAPETRQLRILRWLTALTVSATVVLSIGLFALAAIHGEPYLQLLPALCLPVLASFAVLQLYFHRQRCENEAYWSPARIRQQLPHIWTLYCAGSGTWVRPSDRRHAP